MLQLLRLVLFLPLIGIVVTAALGVVAHYRRMGKPSGWKLAGYSLLYSALGASISFAVMAYSMRTDSSGSNLIPVVWIIFYLPLSVALGQLIAAVRWWLTKVPGQRALRPTSQ